jgi:hypothetical protein
VPDHLVPVTRFGELVVGNTVSACQSCNDSRGEKDWRSFLRKRFQGDAEAQIAFVEAHVARYSYHPTLPEHALSALELAEYNDLLQNWELLLAKARRLHTVAAERRRRQL